MASGIYMILCEANERAYIGHSKNIARRWTEHRYELKNNKHSNTHLQAAYNKYGKDTLTYKILENCEGELVTKEKYHISLIDKKLLFNMTDPTIPGNFGDEFKVKMSSITKGRTHTAESIEKMSNSKLGHAVSDETRKKISETKKERGLTQKQIDANSKRRGKELSTEHKEKVSAAIKLWWSKRKEKV